MDSLQPVAAPASRRERNKLATRRAIATAALDLLREQGYDALTADLIAERAGVSRRTFFNYFASINDALHDHVNWIFERATKILADQAQRLPLMDATVVALEEIMSADLLEKVAYLAIQGESIPSLHATGLATWTASIQYISPQLLAVHPDQDPFTVTVFVQAILGACHAAFQTWARDIALPITDHDLELLGQRLTRAMQLVRDGFPILHSAVGKAQ